MKQLMAMLARSSDAASVVDAAGKVVFWNRAAERLLGFKADEAIGQCCHEVMRGSTLSGQPVCSPACAIAARLTRGGAVRNFDMRTTTKSGRPVWLNISSLPIPTKKRGRYWTVHLFRDITSHARVRQLVEELHAALGCTGLREDLESQATVAPEIRGALPISGRERDVLRLLAQGKDTKSIADALCISPATVRNHIQHILEKLGAHSRLQALVVAFRPAAPSS